MIAILLLALAGCLAWWLWYVGQHTEYTRSARILVASGQSQKASWQPPAGKMFSMLLATSASEDQLHFLSGTLRLHGRNDVLYDRQFVPQDLVSANWLDREGRSSVIIGKGTRLSDDALDTMMAGNRAIDVELLLDHTADFPLELWASWVTSPSIEQDAVDAGSKRKEQ